MNEKISFPDLVTLVAIKLNLTKKESEAFLKEFFTVASEVITSGEDLKINGLGTFKPIWVEPRGSVNVQTGEPVEIPGHYKLSFTPDKVLREAVNAPFSSFSVEVLNDHVPTEAMMPPTDVQPSLEENEPVATQPDDAAPAAVEADSAPSSDIDDTFVDELQPVFEPEPELEEPAPVDPQVEVDPQESVADKAEDPAPEQLSEVLPAEPEQVPTKPEDAVTVETPVESGASVVEEGHSVEPIFDEELKLASRKSFWWGVFATIAVILVAVAAALFWVATRDNEQVLRIGDYYIAMGHEKAAAESSHRGQDEFSPLSESTEFVLNESKDSVAVAESAIPEVEPEVEAEPVQEVIRSGVFLTTLSLRHFGHKAFWVYIYEENKSVIDNPNQVPIGTKLTIPKASKYGIDANDPASIETAKALAVKILNSY